MPQDKILGYLIDGTGIHPTNSKWEAPPPTNKTALQAFLSLLNFYSIFLLQKATVAEPLHRLLDKKADCKWGRNKAATFTAIKELLTSNSILVQYNETLPLMLTCDASPFEIGAVLSHWMPNGNEAPIAFYSKTLSKAEQNYSQLDKEAMAAVAGIKIFHEYLYGRDFELITDLKPLLGMLPGNQPTQTYYLKNDKMDCVLSCLVLPHPLAGQNH
uniref:Reverse transcriptase/retrotransposon-derived protein RNase H-like domain-containing protein n=1 Tax=Micrurus lemniscatus lemniscatus TaxID=129467 RepID=A0A2D4JCH7_MICLE